jgi:soluble lytic murein transglycosylase-like protein
MEDFRSPEEPLEQEAQDLYHLPDPADYNPWPSRMGKFAVVTGVGAALVGLHNSAEASVGDGTVEREVVHVSYAIESTTQPEPDFGSLLDVPDKPSGRSQNADTSGVAVIDAQQTDGGTSVVAGMLSVPDSTLHTPHTIPRIEQPSGELSVAAPEQVPVAPAPNKVPAPPDILPVNGRRVSFYFQGDKEWSAHPYHGGNSRGSIGPNGCGPSTLATVISTLSDHEVNPAEMANYNMEHGYVDPSGSTLHRGLHNAPKDFGLDTYPVGQSVEAVREIIQKGGMVIVNGTDGNANTPATPGGHIFAIRDVTPDNHLLVADPNSRRNSNTAFQPGDIFGPASIAIAVVNPHGAPAAEAPAPPPAPAPVVPVPGPAPAPASPEGLIMVSTDLAMDGNFTSMPYEIPKPAPPTAEDTLVDTGSLLDLGGIVVAQDKTEEQAAAAATRAADPEVMPRITIDAPASAPASAPAPAPAPAEAPAPAVDDKLADKFPNFNAAAVPKDYGHWIMVAADKYRLNPNILAAQLHAESGWDEDVISGRRKSRTGAGGIAQFMPGTWPAHQVDANGNGEASPFDPPDAIMGQAHFMRVLLDQLDHIPGDPYANALAGYNAGGGRVKQFNGVPPISFANGETYNYVKKILANAHKYEK